MLVETRELEAVLRDKGIPAWVDYWGRTSRMTGHGGTASSSIS